MVEFWPIDLKESKRTLIYKQIELANKIEKKGNLKEQDDVESYLEAEIENVIRQYQEKGYQEQKLYKSPIVRLQINYSGLDIIRIKRLEEKFIGRVANEGLFFMIL